MRLQAGSIAQECRAQGRAAWTAGNLRQLCSRGSLAPHRSARAATQAPCFDARSRAGDRLPGRGTRPLGAGGAGDRARDRLSHGCARRSPPHNKGSGCRRRHAQLTGRPAGGARHPQSRSLCAASTPRSRTQRLREQTQGSCMVGGHIQSVTPKRPGHVILWITAGRQRTPHGPTGAAPASSRSPRRRERRPVRPWPSGLARRGRSACASAAAAA